jgi:hypothetical protein
VFEFSIIDVSVLEKNVLVLVSVKVDDVKIPIGVVITGDDCIDEPRVLATLREREVDVTEFMVVSVFIDD